ncbi:MAG: hypothetical protein ABJO30_09065 [Hyphomicrobiales bacterium]
MFGFIKKQRPNIFLGKIGVNEDNLLMQGLERTLFLSRERKAELIEGALRKIITFPPVPSDDLLREDDLILDIIVTKFSIGHFLTFGFIPMGGRANVVLSGHLYKAHSCVSVPAITVMYKSRWFDFLLGPVRLSYSFWSAKSENYGIDKLVGHAALKLLSKISKVT